MTDQWVRDTGLIFSLVFLVLGARYNPKYLLLSGLIILIVMFVPALLRPLARAWLWISETLGFVMNKVFFGAVFFAIVTPVGVVKRWMTGDMRDTSRNTTNTSTFVEHTGSINKNHLARPF